MSQLIIHALQSVQIRRQIDKVLLQLGHRQLCLPLFKGPPVQKLRRLIHKRRMGQRPGAGDDNADRQQHDDQDADAQYNIQNQHIDQLSSFNGSATLDNQIQIRVLNILRDRKAPGALLLIHVLIIPADQHILQGFLLDTAFIRTDLDQAAFVNQADRYAIFALERKKQILVAGHTGPYAAYPQKRSLFIHDPGIREHRPAVLFQLIVVNIQLVRFLRRDKFPVPMIVDILVRIHFFIDPAVRIVVLAGIGYHKRRFISERLLQAAQILLHPLFRPLLPGLILPLHCLDQKGIMRHGHGYIDRL